MAQKPYKAYLIDPFCLTTDEWGKPQFDQQEIVREVEMSADYRDIYHKLTHETMAVSTMEAVHAFSTPGDICYVDEEGLFKNTVDHWFILRGFPQPIRGRGLICGTDREGDSIDPKVAIETVRKNVIICSSFYEMSADLKKYNADGRPSKTNKTIEHFAPAYLIRAKFPLGLPGEFMRE